MIELTSMEVIKRLQPTVADSQWCLYLLEDKMVNAVAEQQDWHYRALLLQRIREELPDYVSPFAERLGK